MSSDDLTTNLDDHALLVQLVTMFQGFGERLQSLEERLQGLETKVDERLYDTRPMWEAVQLQITELRADMEKGFRRADNKVTMFFDKVADLQTYQRDMEERLEKLEPKAS